MERIHELEMQIECFHRDICVLQERVDLTSNENHDLRVNRSNFESKALDANARCKKIE